MNILDQVETVSELARIYSVTPRTLYQAIEKNQMVARKSGGTWLSTRRFALMHLKVSKYRKMLPAMKMLAIRIMRDCEDEDALSSADLDYLNQIQTETDLESFADSGSGGGLALAADAASALGMSREWIEEKDTEWYERERKRRNE